MTRRRSGLRTRKARPSHSRTNDARDRACPAHVLDRVLDRIRDVGEQVEVEVKVETKTEAKAEAGQRDEARSRRKAAPEGAASQFGGEPSMGADLRVRVSITEVDCTNR